jgi:hypothetical protein
VTGPEQSDEGLQMAIVMTVSKARAELFEICRRVSSERVLVVVKEKDDERREGQKFLTFSFTDKSCDPPITEVSPNLLKANFARCCALVRVGFCFRVSVRGGDEPVFIRRFAQYKDPLDQLVQQWRERLVMDALDNDELMAVLREVNFRSRRDSGVIDDIKHALDQIKQGLRRIGVGNQPFDEGEIDWPPPRSRP